MIFFFLKKKKTLKIMPTHLLPSLSNRKVFCSHDGRVWKKDITWFVNQSIGEKLVERREKKLKFCRDLSLAHEFFFFIFYFLQPRCADFENLNYRFLIINTYYLSIKLCLLGRSWIKFVGQKNWIYIWNMNLLIIPNNRFNNLISYNHYRLT